MGIILLLYEIEIFSPNTVVYIRRGNVFLSFNTLLYYVLLNCELFLGVELFKLDFSRYAKRISVYGNKII